MQPDPAFLQKLPKGYDVPFPMLMEWAGYIESTPPSNIPFFTTLSS